MDVTGSLGDKLNQAIDKLPGIEAPIIEAFKAEVAALIAAEQAIVPSFQDAVAADLAPLIEESKAWRERLCNGFVGNIGGMPFEIKAKQ